MARLPCGLKLIDAAAAAAGVSSSWKPLRRTRKQTMMTPLHHPNVGERLEKGMKKVSAVIIEMKAHAARRDIPYEALRLT